MQGVMATGRQRKHQATPSPWHTARVPVKFTNSFGTTSGQIANGGARQSLHFRFNLSRKCF
jgi:hypothetical protein